MFSKIPDKIIFNFNESTIIFNQAKHLHVSYAFYFHHTAFFRRTVLRSLELFQKQEKIGKANG